jgi:hypothetical protein
MFAARGVVTARYGAHPFLPGVALLRSPKSAFMFPRGDNTARGGIFAKKY